MESLIKITLEMDERAIEHIFIINGDYMKHINDVIYKFVNHIKDENLISLEDVQQ